VKAIDRPFTSIINGTMQYVIPVFQRDYNWTEANCEQLWKDVLRIGQETSSRGHFLGSVVYVPTGDSAAGFTRWLLIDGQQRLTTLTLLLAALRDHIAETQWTGSVDGPTAKRIDAYFLKNLQEEGERHHKLVLRRNDQATLRALLDSKELPVATSEHVRDNYDFFREQIADADPELVYRGIGRLVIVDVTLDRNADDPQLIFESLNSTGLDLSQADLIRNFILMRLPEKEQTALYEEYWSKIEALFRGSGRAFDSFVRDYIALQVQASKQEKADEIYFAFRREFGSIGTHKDKLVGFLSELLRFARYNAAFSFGSDSWLALREPLARLRRLVDVPATVIMRLFDCHDRLGTLSAKDFTNAIELLESFVLRRSTCGEQTRGYWQVFANLAYRIDPEKPLTSLITRLALLPETYAFPKDDDFRKALEDRDIYHMRICFDLLENLENRGSKEPTDTRTYSIEHILPQNEKLAPAWRKMLGKEWQSVQREWLHRLGNLTLTGYNSTYSARPFEDKKSIAGGFSESSVRLNKYVRDQDQWTAVEIERRGKQLAKRALAIWPALTADRAMIDEIREADMREKAQRHDVSRVSMSGIARALFDMLRQKVLGIDADIIEIAERKSVSYHGPSFFLEVLPRKKRIGLLLPLDFNEIDDASGISEDTSQWKFFVNAQYEGGVYVAIRDEADIERALPMIHLAREVGRG
jgi:predicted transport protein